MSGPKNFVYDIVLPEPEICNLEHEKTLLLKGILGGKKLVLYGKRNTGKTSLIDSKVVPAFKTKVKRSFVLSVDFLGIHSFEEIELRLARAFELAFSEAFPGKAQFDKMIQLIHSLRPQITVDSQGEWSVSVSQSSQAGKPPELGLLFAEIGKIEKSGYRVLLVFDEFQDIHFVRGADARLRTVFQRLSKETSVILLGSKKHLLYKLLTAPSAPLFNWGEPVELGPIPYEEYHAYMQERFHTHSLSLSKETSIYIQDLLGRIPEPVNILCQYLIETLPPKSTLGKDQVDSALKQLVLARRGKMNEYLAHFSSAEIEVLRALAELGPVLQPTGKEFLKKLTLSKGAVPKIITKLVDWAILYREEQGLVFADPLLAAHLRMQ